MSRRIPPRCAPPMMISMMLHFYAVVGPYAPESARTSEAYTKFVKRLLAEGLIERPTTEERDMYGRAYRATEKGRMWVEAICRTPLPIEERRWVIPL